MRTRGIVGHRPPRLTKPDRTAAPAPDLVGRLFNPDQPDVAWCGDVIWILTDEGCCTWPVSSIWPRGTCSTGRWHWTPPVTTRGGRRMPDTIFASRKSSWSIATTGTSERRPHHDLRLDRLAQPAPAALD
jgi:hypothetical protein